MITFTRLKHCQEAEFWKSRKDTWSLDQWNSLKLQLFDKFSPTLFVHLTVPRSWKTRKASWFLDQKDGRMAKDLIFWSMKQPYNCNFLIRFTHPTVHLTVSRSWKPRKASWFLDQKRRTNGERLDFLINETTL